jgi:hypothetical protein
MHQYKPLQRQDYISKFVKHLLLEIEKSKFSKINLIGFSEAMKWLSTLLREKGFKVTLYDWRKKYYEYDCGGIKLNNVKEIKNIKNNLLVICSEDLNEIKDCMKILIANNLNKIPVIYYYSYVHNPLRQVEPYRTIFLKAENRAKSMISDNQLFDLIQLVDLKKNIEGDVVEFGSLHGGSGAVLAESLNFFGKKNLYLFDTFSGIPRSKYGLDYRWDGSFSDNSYEEVKSKFLDLDYVKVIKGNINNTYKKLKNKISIGYIASDTLESGILLLNFIWKKLNNQGSIIVCDYGSFPNCIPLTVIVEKFIKENSPKSVYYTFPCGIIITK